MFPVRKLVLFALLGLCDFGLTWHLVETGGGAIYESNPVAAWCLGNHGWLALAGFKAATMGVAAGLSLLVFLRRPAAGHRMLAFACLALAAVVVYSGYVRYDLSRRPAGLEPAEATRLRQTTERLDASLERGRAYRDVLAAAVRDLRGGRCDLKEAVARLSATEHAQDPSWVRAFETYYPGRSSAECLAITLVNHIDADRAGASSTAALRRDLETQFVALYGHSLPGALRRGPVPRSAGPA